MPVHKNKTPAKAAAKKKAVAKARKKPGGSNVGKFPGVKKFAGPAGGAPAGSFPINTRERAVSALGRAGNAPNPAGIRKAVYAAYPSLRPSKKGKK